MELGAPFHVGTLLPTHPSFAPPACLKVSHQLSDTVLCSHIYDKVLYPEDEKTVVILYHKPPNVITSHSNADAVPANSNEKQRRTVYQDIELLKGYNGNSGSLLTLNQVGIQSTLHAIGRLDVDTTGLLLVTNDGGLVHHVTNPTPASSISKTYEAVIMGYWNDTSPEFENMLVNGVDIGAKYGGLTKPPVALRVIDHPTSKSTRVEITLQEGKNRQVRRMFHAIGSGVMKLARTRIGDNLTLGDLEEGEWRILTDDEVKRHLSWKSRVLERTIVVEKRGTRGRPRRSGFKRRTRVTSSRQKKREG